MILRRQNTGVRIENVLTIQQYNNITIGQSSNKITNFTAAKLKT